MEGVSHFSIRYGCLMLSSCSSCRVADKCMHDLCCVHFSHDVLCKVQLILPCINKLSFVTMFVLKALFPYLHNMTVLMLNSWKGCPEWWGQSSCWCWCRSRCPWCLATAATGTALQLLADKLAIDTSYRQSSHCCPAMYWQLLFFLFSFKRCFSWSKLILKYYRCFYKFIVI